MTTPLVRQVFKQLAPSFSPRETIKDLCFCIAYITAKHCLNDKKDDLDKVHEIISSGLKKQIELILKQEKEKEEIDLFLDQVIDEM